MVDLSHTDQLQLTDEQRAYLDGLRRQTVELADSMHRLTSLQDQLLTLRTSRDVEQALDAMETLLEEIVDFTYLRLYLRRGEDSEDLQLAREMCPQDYPTKWDLLGWALAKQEVSLIPLEESDDETVKSILFLPLVGHSEQVGILALWVDFGMTEFTQERSILLGLLARETASVIETLRLRKRVEATRAELADVVETIPLGILAVDEEERLTLVNGTAEFIFDVNRNTDTGRPLSGILSPQALGRVRALIRGEGQNETGETEVELDLSGEMGESFGVSVTPLRRTASGSDPGEEEASAGHVIVCRDLKLSREVAKLRELDAMKNDFLSLVSHELRTPLTSIMAYSETLLMEGMIESEEERKEYLEIIHSEGERLSRLINDVLDLTKMESGKMEYSYEDLDIGDVIHSAVSAVHSLAAQKSMAMPVEKPDDLPLVRADSDKLIQVLTNLYSNAIKFTDEGGAVSTAVRVAPAEEIEDAVAPMIEVAVSDTGMGIAPEDIHKVFSKFEQIEKIDHHSVGTGLGMPIVKQIVEEGHAGQIWIESEVGVGTTVSFRLPVQ